MVAWLWGRCQISSQLPLASWQRNVAMPVAPGMVQRMPDSFSRCPMICIRLRQCRSRRTCPGAVMLVAHAEVGRSHRMSARLLHSRAAPSEP